MSEKYKKALRIAVNVGCGFEGDAEDAAELLTLITGLESRIAGLEGFIGKLIELGEWGITGMKIATSFRGGEMHNLAIKQGDKWDALVKDWKEREE